MIATITGDTDLMENAYSLAQRALSLPADIPFYTSMARGALALRAVQQQDATAAAEQYTALRAIPGIMLLYVNTDRVLGLLAQTMEDLDLAIAHFEDALAFCRRAGYHPELAWACHDYANLLVQREGPGDHAKAAFLLEESRSISTELGMRPLLERVTDLQARLKSLQTVAPAHPDGLTAREVEVLQLIAQGKSNTEIAEDLVLSVRTVERHITNIYTKIHARGRADATSYVLSHQLVPDS